MATMPVPENFDWVKGRYDCSLYQMFKKLQMGVASDVDVRTKLEPPTRSKLVFSFINGGNRFSVVREDYRLQPDIPTTRSVDFALLNDAISVLDDGNAFMSIDVTLATSGRCIYSVNGEELEEWQVRKMALEKIFFDSPKK